DAEVLSLIVKDDQVIGVEINNGQKLYAKDIVLATDIISAKRILKKMSIKQSWIKSIIKIPTMSALTIQFDLTKPSLPYDRTTFGPQTMMTSFAEQSRSTFRHVPGRLSVIIGDPKRYIDNDNEVIYNQILKEASKLGINLKGIITDYRIIRERDKFYHLGPHHDWMRPTQKTPIKGLTLAGDYTRQPLYATMEGAVISGQRAAANIIGE
ncbi:MAG: FAD-dependent oxidoreductase, partial [Bacilli bacterium]|nr:FAD-dependent oxidoreductase [Bacilli bacterium]